MCWTHMQPGTSLDFQPHQASGGAASACTPHETWMGRRPTQGCLAALTEPDAKPVPFPHRPGCWLSHQGAGWLGNCRWTPPTLSLALPIPTGFCRARKWSRRRPHESGSGIRSV